MSLNLNKVVLCGRITSTPELKVTPSGLNVTGFNLAINRKAKNGEEAQADFVPCVAWRRTAEFICKYFTKGSALCVVGSIQTRKWQDKNGENRFSTEVIVDEALFAEAKKATATNGTTAEPYVPATYAQTPAKANTTPTEGKQMQLRPADFSPVSGEEDLPF